MNEAVMAAGAISRRGFVILRVPWLVPRFVLAQVREPFSEPSSRLIVVVLVVLVFHRAKPVSARKTGSRRERERERAGSVFGESAAGPGPTGIRVSPTAGFRPPAIQSIVIPARWRQLDNPPSSLSLFPSKGPSSIG